MQSNHSPAKNEESRVEMLIATVDNLTKTLDEQFTSQQRNLEASYHVICEQINAMRMKVECALANSNESANMNTFSNLGIFANKNGINGMSREQILAMNGCATPVKDTFVMQATPHNKDALTYLEHLQNSIQGKTDHREEIIAQNNTYNNQQSGMQAQSNFASANTNITTPVITPPVHISEPKNYETVFSPVSHSSTSPLSVSHAKSHVSQTNEKNTLYSRSARSLTESLADTSPLHLQGVNNTSSNNNNDAENLMMMMMMKNGNSNTLTQKSNNENDIYALENMNANNAKDLKSMTTMTTMMSKDGRGEANNLHKVEGYEKDNISNRNRGNEESYLPNVQYYTTSATPIKTRMTAAFNAYQQMQNENMNNNNYTDASSVNENNELGLSNTWNDNFVANVMNDYNAYATNTTSSSSPSLLSSSAAWKQNVLATFPSSEMQTNMHYFTGYGNSGGGGYSSTNANIANAYDQTPKNVGKTISDYNGNSVKVNGVPLQLHHEESRNLTDIQSRTLGHSESTGLTDSSHTDVNAYHDVQLLDSIKSLGSQQIANNSINNTPLHTNIVPFSPEQRLSKQYFTNTVRAVYKKGRPHVVKVLQTTRCPSSNTTDAPNMVNGSNSNSSNNDSSSSSSSNNKNYNNKNEFNYNTGIVNHKNNNTNDENISSNDGNDSDNNMHGKDDASIETIEVDNDFIDEFNDENLKKLGIDRTSSCKVLVEFKRERVYEYKSACFISPGSYVIVQADRGEDLGVVINTLCETRHELLEDEQVSNNPQQQLHQQQQQQCERESQTEKSLSSLNISATPRSEATSPNKLGSSRYSNNTNNNNTNNNELVHSAILNSGSSYGDNVNAVVINNNNNFNNHRSGAVTEGVIEICLTGSTVPRSVGVDKGIILQLASKSDVEQLHGVQVELERRAVDVCSQRVLERALPMVIVDAEYQFDTKKIIFFYEAQQRMDFRELLRDLFKTFRARI